MISISIGGLIGATVGVVVATAFYYLLVGTLQRSLMDRAATLTAEERIGQEAKFALLRRFVLVGDLLAFTALGYWIGDQVIG